MTKKISSILVIILISLCLFGLGLSLYSNKAYATTNHDSSIEDFLEFESQVMELTNNHTENFLGSPDSIEDIESEFQLKRLLVYGDLKQSYGAFKTISYKNVHILAFNTIAETEFAYNKLKNDPSFNVIIDKKVSLEGYADNEYDYSSCLNWGAQAADIGGYLDYLNDNKSLNTDKEVVVVVIDTGINTSHELFQDRLLKENGKIVGYSYYGSGKTYSNANLAYEGNTLSFEDDHGHGSHVAGIICGLTPANVKILPIKINKQNKNESTTIDVGNAYLRVLEVYSNKYNIVCTNLSFSGAGKDSEYNRDYFNSVCYQPLLEKNILSITSAGNESVENNIEGLDAIVVSALKNNDNYYELDTEYSNYGKIVDISAPGSDIFSAYISSQDTACSNIYATAQGTSMASPQVTGIVALLYLDPNLAEASAREIEQVLYNNSLDLGETGYDTLYGHGMVNLRYFQVKKTAELNFYENDKLVKEYVNKRNFSEEFSLGIKCTDPNFTIIYTNDKKIPSLENHKSYSSALSITTTNFIYAMGIKIVDNEIVERTNLYNISYTYNATPLNSSFKIDSAGNVYDYIGNFSNITIPQFINGTQVKKIGNELFLNDNFLKSISIPASCTSIGAYAFQGCSNLQYVYAPNVNKLYGSAFKNSSIPFVTDSSPESGTNSGCYLPSLTSTTSGVFNDCDRLEWVKLDNITQVNALDFAECDKLESFNINKNINYIDNTAFTNNKLKSFTIDEENKYYFTDGHGLYDTTSLIAFTNAYIGDYTIVDNVTINSNTTNITTIGSNVVYNATLNNFTIPQNITNIGNLAIYQSSIDNLYLNASLASNDYTDTIDALTTYFPPFSYSVIDNLIIGSIVNNIPEACFMDSYINNITIPSSNCNLSLDCFNVSSISSDHLINLYLEFDSIVYNDWLTMLDESNIDLNLKAIYSRTTLDNGYNSILSLNYLGEFDDYHVYSDKAYTISTSTQGNGNIAPSGEILVFKGDNKTFIITADSDSSISDVVVNGTSQGKVNTYTFSNIASNNTIEAIFEKNKFNIIVIGDEDIISPYTNQEVEYGDSISFTIINDAGYTITKLLIDGENYLNEDVLKNGYTFVNVTDNHTIEIDYIVNSYDLTYDLNYNGSSAITKEYEYKASIDTYNPTRNGYNFLGWYLDKNCTNPFTSTTMPSSDLTIYANWEIIYYSISATHTTNGSISPSGITTTTYNNPITYNFIPNEGYHICSISIDGEKLTGQDLDNAINFGYTFENILSDHTIHVDFEKNTYTISPSCGEHGSMSETTLFSLTHGDTKEIYIYPDTGYEVSLVSINGTQLPQEIITEINTTGILTLENITENSNINIEFAKIIYSVSIYYNDNEEPQVYKVEYGKDFSIDFEVPIGHEIKTLTVNNEVVSSNNTYYITNINQNYDIHVNLSKIVYTIYVQGNADFITPCQNINIEYGENFSFTFIENNGYIINEIKIDSDSYTAEEMNTIIQNGIHFYNIDSNHTLNISYSINTYELLLDLNYEDANNITESYEYKSSITLPNDLLRTGYTFKGWYLDSACTTHFDYDSMPSNNLTAYAKWEINKYIVTASSNDNGTITPSGETEIIYNQNITYTITPNEGYHVNRIKINDTYLSYEQIQDVTTNGYQFLNVSENQSIEVEFAINTYNITLTYNVGGEVTINDESQPTHGSSKTYNFIPTIGYKIKKVYVDSISIGDVNTYTFDNITRDHTIHVEFQKIQFNVSILPYENGKITPKSDFMADYGSNIEFVITPDNGYDIAYIKVNSNTVETTTKLTINNITENTAIEVKFLRVYTITSTSNAFGSVTPSCDVFEGETLNYVISPNEGYRVKNVKIDNQDMGAITSFCFNEISSSHNIEVEFAPIEYKINVYIKGEGNIECNDALENIAHGDNRTLLINPKNGWKLSSVYVNNLNTNTIDNQIVLENIQEDYIIEVIFEKEPVNISQIIFIIISSISVVSILFVIVKIIKNKKIK